MHEIDVPTVFADRKPLKQLIEEYERRMVSMALELSGGNQARAAASLGLLPSTLSEKLKRFGMRSAKTSADAPGYPHASR